MKLRWKIFFAMLLVVLLTFSLGATFLISVTFHSTLNREKQSAESQNQLMRASVAALLASVQTDQWENRKETVQNVMKELSDSPEKDAFVRIREKDSVLYEQAGCPAELPEELPDTEEMMQTMSQTGENWNLRTVSSLTVNGTVLYVENWRNVNGIFADRENLVRIYRWIVLGAAAGTALVSLLISFWIAGPVSRLSKVAREIAGGNLEARAGARRKDELGMLALDINQMAEHLEEDFSRLQEKNEQQERFIGNFAHELKTPLTSIIGYADMLRLHKNDPEFTVEAAGYIFSEGKRLEHLSAKLLEIILLKQGQIEKKKIAAGTFLEHLSALLKPVLSEKNLHLYIDISPEGTALYGDEELLETVFLNLIDNSRKACQKGGNIWVRILEENNAVTAEVKDDGRGMEQSELPKLTEAFYMEDKSRSRRQGGVGLGLSVCAEIVRLHGARMSFDSRPGKGMRVRLIFPISQNSPEDCTVIGLRGAGR